MNAAADHDKVFNPATGEWERPRYCVSYSTTAAMRHGGYNVHCATREQADAEFGKAVGSCLSRKFEAVEVESLGVGVLRRVHVVHARTRRVWHVVQMTEMLTADELMAAIKASPSYRARFQTAP